MTDYNSVNQDEGFIGVGTPWFQPEGSEKVYYWGNPITFKVTPASETKARESRRVEDAGQALDSVTKGKPTTGEFSTDTFSPMTWAMMTMGETARKEKTTQTIANEAAKAVTDGYHPLANESIDAATVTVSNGGTALTADQFEVIANKGFLRIKPEANITEGTDLTVSYQTKDVKYLEIDAQKVTAFKGKFGIDGRNEVNGRRCELVAPNISMAVNSDFDWFSDDYNSITVSTTLSKGKQGESAYTIKYFDAE